MEDITHSTNTTWVVRPDPDLEDLIPSFMGNRRSDLNDIRDAISRKDFEFIRRTAHTLKGICRPYGFEHLETLSKELEAAGEREDLPSVQSVSTRMQDYIDNVRIVYDS
jgi:HPt (histidine-containing phosphotransfer) domain-containing protein